MHRRIPRYIIHYIFQKEQSGRKFPPFFRKRLYPKLLFSCYTEPQITEQKISAQIGV